MDLVVRRPQANRTDNSSSSPIDLAQPTPVQSKPKADTDKPRYPEITAEVLHQALYGKQNRITQEALELFSDPGCVRPTPSQVRLAPSSIPGERLGVWSCAWIPCGTEMGALPGSPTPALDPSSPNPSAWEVFNSEGEIDYFWECTDDLKRCWLHYVNCARHEQEQNLDLVQMGNELFYRANKDIPPDQELLVWYGPSYQLYLGVPGAGKCPAENAVSRLKGKQDAPTASTSASALKCVLCQRTFNSRSNLRSHMRTHTLERPFACRFCQRKFSQSSTLRNHVRLHTGEKPYKCLVCQSAYSQLAGLRAHQKSARHRPAAKTDLKSGRRDAIVEGTPASSP